MKEWEGELIDLDEGEEGGYEDYDDSEIDVYQYNEEDVPRQQPERAPVKNRRRPAKKPAERRRKPAKKKANRDLLTRVKHSVIAFLIALVSIALIVWVGFGKRIKESVDNGERFGVRFILSVLYPEKYSYSSETADLNDYFRIFSKDDIAIILQDELYGARGKYYDGTVYFSLATVEELFTDRFYYNETEGELLYSKSDTVIRVRVGEESREYEEGNLQFSEPYQIARIGTDGVLYVAAEYVQKYADFSFQFYPGSETEPNRMQVYTRWETQRIAQITSDTKVRFQGGIKSDILCSAEKGDTVVVLEVMENWSKIKTEDCYIGYVENAKLSEITEQMQTAVTDAYHPWEDYRMTPPIERVLVGFHMLGGADDGTGMQLVTANATGLNVVCPTWYYLDGMTGSAQSGDAAVSYRSQASAAYVTAAHARGYQVWALVENMTYDIDEEALFSSSAHREALIDALVEEAATYGFDGINMDIELPDAMLNKAGEHYVQFLRELSIACHTADLALSVDVPVPLESNSEYDWQELGYVTDYVIMMGYDEHWAGSDAGSVASIGFVEGGIRDLIEQGVPAEKTVCAVPFYTRIWRVEGASTSSEAVGMDSAIAWVENHGLTPRWDEESCQNYAETADGTALYQVWLEDADSMKARLDVVAGYGVRGVAAWRLGLESDGTWDIIDRAIP